MVQKPTVVKYDVSQSVTELEKLNKAVDKSGDVAKTSFGDADKAADDFGGSITGLIPPSSKLSGTFTQLATTGGLAGTTLATLALGGVQVANAFFNLPELFKDTNEQLEALKAGGRAAQDFADSASAVGDALALRNFTVRRRELTAAAAELTDEQNRIDVAKRAAQETLTVELAKFRSIETAARDSAKAREDIEKRLQDKRSELAGDAIGRGKTAGGAIADLTGAASEAARKGDVDRAEQLVERAKKLSAELGNHSFFTNQIDKANNEIVRSLEKQAREAGTREQIDRGAADAAQAQIEIIEARKRALDEEFALISRNLRAVGAERRRVRIGREEETETQNAEQAARDIATARKELERLNTAGKSLGDILGDFARGVPDSFTRSSERARELSEEFGELSGRATIAQGILEGTPLSIQRAGEEAAKLKDALAGLQADPNFPAELNRQADQIENLLDTVQRASTGAAGAAAAGVRGTEDIESGAERIRTQTNLAQLDAQIAKSQQAGATAAEKSAAAEERSAVAAERRVEAFQILTGGELPNVPATSPVTSDGGTSVAAGGGGAVPVQQTININVKGGVIDRELTEQIADIADREFRKLTAQQR